MTMIKTAIAIVIIIIFAVCEIINFINYKFYSELIDVKYNRNTKYRKSGHLTLKETKERCYPQYRYAVVNVEFSNYPSWICKDIEEARERVKDSCQRLYIVDFEDAI
nr:MAG TPA: hypothetical protein [Caudoviricetes sp.]